MKRLVLLFIALLVLPGCVTGGYGKYYYGRNDIKPTKNVQLYQYTYDAWRDLLDTGYYEIGESSFNGPMENYNNAIEQGKKVGADIVLIESNYTGTTQGVLSLPQYHPGQTATVTTQSSGNVNIYGTGGTAHGIYSGSSTSYITTPGYTTYQQVPYSVDRYDQRAVFLKKGGDTAYSSWSSTMGKAGSGEKWEKSENEYYMVQILPSCKENVCKSFNFYIKNKTDKSIEVDWLKTFYTHNGEKEGTFMLMGNKDLETPDIVSPKSSIVKFLYPINLASNDENNAWNYKAMPEGKNGVDLTVSVDGRVLNEKLSVNLPK